MNNLDRTVLLNFIEEPKQQFQRIKKSKHTIHVAILENIIFAFLQYSFIVFHLYE